MSGPGWHLIGDEELKEVTDVLRSRELSRYRFNDPTGDAPPSKVYQFERACEALVGVRHCLAVNSCTSALLAGLSALGVGPGDEVIVPGYTFIASAAAVAYARATPVLADIDESLTLDPADVERKITPRTKAVIAVHMLGAPCDMDALTRIAREHRLALVEDVAQACGGRYKGAWLGSIGAFGAFSLNIFKTITSGDGGMLTTNDTALYERAFAFHDHGSKPLRQGLADDGSVLGLNLRMNELVGAVALAQVRKLEGIVESLRAKKKLFKGELARVPGLRFRTLHDPEGECATILALVFESADRADAVARALGSKTLLRSGKHYYGNMIQLLNKNMPAARGCPFDCESYPAPAEYSPGMLPQTDDILGRTLVLSVGVQDSYLGTDFGVGFLDDERAVVRKAEEFRRLTAGVL